MVGAVTGSLTTMVRVHFRPCGNISRQGWNRLDGMLGTVYPGREIETVCAAPVRVARRPAVFVACGRSKLCTSDTIRAIRG